MERFGCATPGPERRGYPELGPPKASGAESDMLCSVDKAVVVILVVIGGIAVLSLLIAIAIHAAKKERERTESLLAMCREFGWTFDASRVTGFDSQNSQFSCFKQGHSRSAYNLMRGEMVIDQRPYGVTAGDYTYKVTTSNGKTTTTVTYNFSFLLVHTPFPGVPDLFVRREHFFDKIAGAIGFDDIDFESAEFSRKFFVKSSDRKFAFAVIHPRMMEFMMGSDPPPIELRGGDVCFHGGTGRWDAAQFRTQLGFAVQFFDLWPDYLQQDLAARQQMGLTP